MKNEWAYYKKLIGEILVVITISLVLGVAIHEIMNDRPPPIPPDEPQARGQPTTEAPRHDKPLAPERQATVHPTGSSSRAARPSAPSTRPPQNTEPILSGITAQVGPTERRPTTVAPPEPPPIIPPAAMVPLATPLEDIPTVPEEDPPLEESGDLAISGIVLTEGGEPVPDLEITATVNQLFETDAQGTRPNQQYQARTDDDGEYEFPELFDGEYTLQTAATPPYQSTSTRVRAGTEEITLVVADARSQKVQGLVTQSHNGAPLAGVNVTAASHTTATDDAGHYTLTVPVAARGKNPTRLQFTHPNYREQQVIVPRSTYQADQTITLKDVAMEVVEGRAAVSGLVESQIGGNPLTGMRVFLAPAKGPGQQDTLTAQDGTFHFPDVPWGTYTLVVVPKTGYQDLTHPNLQVTEAGVEDLHLQLTSVPTSTLSGQFVDPVGQPVRGLTLWLTSRTVRTFTGKSVTSDTSGHFLLHDVPAGELEFITRSAPHFTITGLTLQAGVTAPVALPVDWGLQTLTGQVVTAGNIPLPGAEITLIWSQTAHGITSRAIRHGTADATGTFRFTQLGPGRHTLNVSASGYTRTLVEHEVGPEHPTVQVTLVARAS